MNAKTAIHAAISVIARIIEFWNFNIIFGNVFEDIFISLKR